MKIARALSVSEGKGSVNCVASQSKDGTFCLGYRAAWLSGPEKSRHFKQDVWELDWFTIPAEGLVAIAGLGFVAIILDRSGLVDFGTGGGALSKPSLLGISGVEACLVSIVGPFSDRALTGGMVVGGRRLAYAGGGGASVVGVL